MNAVIIVASGLGKRFNSDIPKQFLKINKKEILSFSVETFISHPKINEVIIVTHKDWINHVKNKYPKCKIIIGGSYRQKSVMNGINTVSQNITNILIHDAARPLISDTIISNCIEALNHYDGTAPILNISDSIIKLQDNKINIENRDEIKIVQTPQCFKLKQIKDISFKNNYFADEISMMINNNPQIKIKFIPGCKKNLKITTQFDFDIIKSIISKEK